MTTQTMLQVTFAIFNFALVAFLLYKFAGPMVVKALAERHAANLRMLTEAEEARKQAATRLDEQRERLAGVDAELGSIVSQAKELAVKVGADLEATAETDAKRLKAQAESEIHRAQLVARREVQRVLLTRSLEAAKEELVRQMNPEVQRALVARFVHDVEEGACPIRL